MQSVNGALFLNATSLSPLFGLSPACAAIDIVPLKELRNCISRSICVWSLFCSIQVYTSLHFLMILFGKLVFYISVFFALCRIRSNIHKFYNICTIIDYIAGVRCCVFFFSLFLK